MTVVPVSFVLIFVSVIVFASFSPLKDIGWNCDEKFFFSVNS